MTKIVIPNVYGTNIGDISIAEVALKLLSNHLSSGSNIDLLSVDEKKTPYSESNIIINTSLSPYGYAVRSHDVAPNNFVKIYRFFVIIIKTLFLISASKLNADFIPEKGFYSFIRKIKNADAVINIGGGYLRTKHVFRDFFGLILTLLPIYIARFYKKPILCLPMSFGDFATALHSRIARNALNNVRVILRDKPSMDEFNKYRKDNTPVYAPDLALYYQPDDFSKVDINKKFSSKYWVLTAREWLPAREQIKFEKNLVLLVNELWQKYQIQAVFVPMAYNRFEDDDNKVADRILNHVLDKNLFKILNVTQPSEVQNILRDAKFALCTRMHSAILAATVFTPFVAIAYEYKTSGFLDNFGLSEWGIDIRDVDAGKLTSQIINLFDISKYRQFIATLEENRLKDLKYEKIIDKEIEKCLPGDINVREDEVMSVDIGIAAYNAEKNIKTLLHSLISQEASAYIINKIIVHSDQSSDETVKLAHSIDDKRLEIVESQQRRGFKGSVETIMTISNSKILILLNDDIKILDNNFLANIIKPFRTHDHVGLVCGNCQPLPGINFLDRAIISGFRAYDRVRYKINNGNTVHTVDGKILAISRGFKSAISFDQEKVGNLDGFIYFLCLEKGFKYVNVRQAVVMYRNPTNIKDYLNWFIRNHANRYLLKKRFGSIVDQEFSFPGFRFSLYKFYEFIKNPPGSLFLFLMSFYINYKSKKSTAVIDETWEVIQSSKNLS